MTVSAALIDLDGVVYQAGAAVPGAPEVIDWLESERIPHLFITNTTSRPRGEIVKKLADMDIGIEADRILTPPIAAVEWLSENARGAAALFVADATRAEFRGVPVATPGEPAAAVVIGDYGEQWSFAELNRAFRLLMAEPRPALVALGMTRYWMAPDGLRLDTGAFVTALAHASGVEPIVLGKPAPAFFAAALEKLGVSPADTVMIGDDIRADVDGAQQAGIRGVLVRMGKFRPADLDAGVTPHSVIDSIADLPDLWLRNKEAEA